MKKIIEKLIERLEEEKSNVPVNRILDDIINDKPKELGQLMAYSKAIKIAKELAEEYKDTNVSTINVGELFGNGWIPCSERLPKVETEVLIVAKQKWKDGTCKYITTTAMYEDGTVLENDSCWRWEDIDGEWDEANECCIIPEGWWENKHYNADGELNHAVDNEVIAWQPLPAPYQPKGEQE